MVEQCRFSKSSKRTRSDWLGRTAFSGKRTRSRASEEYQRLIERFVAMTRGAKKFLSDWGGTFGLGKAVLWRASAIQTVLFFSRLSLPADGAIFRAAAQARLCNHYRTTQQYRGLGFGGKMHGEFCAPLSNTEATEFARALETHLRGDSSDVGTTIIVPFWEAPPSKADDRGVEMTALLARYAARYFWPAIIEDRLDVSITDGTRTSNARDHLTKYNSFIELYRRVRADAQDARDAAPERINFVVPPGPPPLRESEAHTFIRCGLTFIDPENPERRVSDDLLEKIAEIRGQGMVIGYQRLTGRARVKPFVGIALGGRIADDRDSGIRGDMLLGYSEHVTHTRWDEEAEALDNWPDARSRVRNLLEKVAGYFQRNAGIAPPRTSDDLSAVEEGLHFPGVKEGGTTPPPPPPPGIPQLSKRAFQQQDGRYVFDVRARVEPNKPPVRLDVWVEAGIETGRPSREDRLRLESIETTPAGLSVDYLGDGKVRIEVPTFDTAMQIRVFGQTEPLSPEVLPVTEAELRAKVERLDMPQTPDPVPSGERADAES